MACPGELIAAVPLETRHFEDLGCYLPAPMVERVRVAEQHAGELLGGRTVWMVNSAALGGGVAQLLRTLLPYWKGAGIDVRWMVLRGSGEFFRVTKRLHNHLQGQPGDGGALGIEELTTLDRAAPLPRTGAGVPGRPRRWWSRWPGGTASRIRSGFLTASSSGCWRRPARTCSWRAPTRAQVARERVRALFLNHRHFVRWVEIFGSALERGASATGSTGPTAAGPTRLSHGAAAPGLDLGDHDALTGLWNRRRFEKELDRARQTPPGWRLCPSTWTGTGM